MFFWHFANIDNSDLLYVYCILFLMTFSHRDNFCQLSLILQRNYPLLTKGLIRLAMLDSDKLDKADHVKSYIVDTSEIPILHENVQNIFSIRTAFLNF